MPANGSTARTTYLGALGALLLGIAGCGDSAPTAPAPLPPEVDELPGEEPEDPGPDLVTGLISHFDLSPADGSGYYLQDLVGRPRAMRTVSVVGAVDRHGDPDHAMAFDGQTSFLSAYEDRYNSPTDELTLAAWVYVEAWGPAGRLAAPVVVKSDQAEDAFQYRMVLAPKAVLIAINESANASVAPYLVPLQTWLHVAATFDRGSVTTYVGGEPIHTATLPVAAIDPGFKRLVLGRNVPGNDEHLNGRLDDVRVWSRALTAEEIALLVANESDGPPARARILSRREGASP